MKKHSVQLALWAVGVFLMTAMAVDAGVSASGKAERMTEATLRCWQNGQRIVDEKDLHDLRSLSDQSGTSFELLKGRGKVTIYMGNNNLCLIDSGP
ncbi:MAG: hypothetical protein HQL58_06530 [Magnetococcales bacterium]|nr:hypothetical protein [Magnetococcales bacterium]